MADLDNIGQYIDKILNSNKWTEKQMDFYNLLRNKISQYQHHVQDFELLQDKEDIINNIKEQSWYIHSQYKTILSSLLSEIEIESYQYQNREGIIQTNLCVKFTKSKFRLYAYYNLDKRNESNLSKTAQSNLNQSSRIIKGKFIKYKKNHHLLQFYVYLEDFDQVKRLYLAYNDNLNTLHLNKNLKLPQLDDIFTLIKTGTYISKIELLKLFTEIILYYDESGQLTQTHIGVSYPITLLFFLYNL